MNALQNETGRSMVEMLGVLAIIGVLSISGIQGYTYAMNKYRANQVLNEINMASHQLAIELLASRNEQKMLSLGDPYDNGTMMTENYPFAYGCGNYDSAERACQQTEYGYWISVSGLSKKICQSVLPEAGNLPYIVTQELNGEIITDGVNYSENDNEILFLFNSDESGELEENVGVGNGNGNDNSDDEDEPTPTVSCPENTSKDGQGGLAVRLTDEATGKVLNCYCELNTKYTDSGTCDTLPPTCSSNAECNRRYYCDISCSGSNCYTTNTSNKTGTCQEVEEEDIQPAKPNTNPPFVRSKNSMNWWTAVNFCQALDMRLVTLNDYKCSTSQEKCNSEIVESMNSAYDPGYGWTNTEYSSSAMYIIDCGDGSLMNFIPNMPLYAVCTF